MAAAVGEAAVWLRWEVSLACYFIYPFLLYRNSYHMSVDHDNMPFVSSNPFLLSSKVNRMFYI
jgi:hypothetical protein